MVFFNDFAKNDAGNHENKETDLYKLRTVVSEVSSFVGIPVYLHIYLWIVEFVKKKKIF